MSALREAFGKAIEATPEHRWVAPLKRDLERTTPKPRTKEQSRGWGVKLSFKTHRKLTTMGFEAL